MDIFNAFPKAGVVTAAPVPNIISNESTLRLAYADKNARVETGSFVSEKYLRAYAESMGKNSDSYVKSK